ncbi:MAG: SusC/RagA family protein, partial [Mariniphaga sp.]|nr:SusC/RagA family protein [Mariniphaga sp.]
MKRIILLFSLILSFSVLFAQQKSITGRVTDENNDPVPGTTVVAKGTTSGTVTDADGKYAIKIPETTKVLTFSFIGFEPQDVNVVGKSAVSIKLQLSSIGLEEVVAVGYGTQKKVNLTGSIES